MDLRDRVEVYIPAKAEVKSIPLWSLPKSVLRRTGLPLSDASGSKKLTNSPKAVWISPAVVRRRSQKPSGTEQRAGNGAAESALSLLSRECRASSGPFRMSFAFSNHAAYKVLKDTGPGSKVPTLPPHASSLPQGLASRTYRTAVVVCSGRVYLSVRRPGRGQAERGPARPAPTPGLPVRGRLKSHKKDLLNEKKKKKRNASCKVTRSPNKKRVGRKERDVSSSTTAPSAPRATVGLHSVDGCCRDDAGVKQTPDDLVVQQSDWLQPQGQEEQEEVANSDGVKCVRQDARSEEAESIDQNNDFDGEAQADGGDVDRGSRTRREPPSAACSSASLQSRFDFKELAEEEEIARTKARLRHSAACLMAAQSEPTTV